jgi:hypothetical protein
MRNAGGAADGASTAETPSVRFLRPETCYARSGDVMVAYQVTGEDNTGDVVLAPGMASHVDLAWESLGRADQRVLPFDPLRQAWDWAVGSAHGWKRRSARLALSRSRIELVSAVGRSNRR